MKEAKEQEKKFSALEQIEYAFGTPESVKDYMQRRYGN
jgi:hypothetical protein